MRDYMKYKRMPKPPYKDNNGYFNNGRAGNSPRYIPDPMEWHYGMHRNDTIRIPSMKRGKSTWKRFYRLFPELRYRDTFRGQKLKKI
jgi:hypothetical protein